MTIRPDRDQLLQRLRQFIPAECIISSKSKYTYEWMAQKFEFEIQRIADNKRILFSVSWREAARPDTYLGLNYVVPCLRVLYRRSPAPIVSP